MTPPINSVSDERDRLIHILVVHFDMFRSKAEEAADLFLHHKSLRSGNGGAVRDCQVCGGDCSSANPPVYDCPRIDAEAEPIWGSTDGLTDEEIKTWIADLRSTPCALALHELLAHRRSVKAYRSALEEVRSHPHTKGLALAKIAAKALDTNALDIKP